MLLLLLLIKAETNAALPARQAHIPDSATAPNKHQ
jgi:hypothetical protein